MEDKLLQIDIRRLETSEDYDLRLSERCDGKIYVYHNKIKVKSEGDYEFIKQFLGTWFKKDVI